MDSNNLEIEVFSEIEKLNLNSYGKLAANLAGANFIYLLRCLERDFKEQQSQSSDKGDKEPKV